MLPLANFPALPFQRFMMQRLKPRKILWSLLDWNPVLFSWHIPQTEHCKLNAWNLGMIPAMGLASCGYAGCGLMGLSRFRVGMTSNDLEIKATAKNCQNNKVAVQLKLLGDMFCQCCACVSNSVTLQLRKQIRQHRQLKVWMRTAACSDKHVVNSA